MRRLESLMKHLLLALHKAVATTCYTQNRSIIRLRRGKPQYELLHDKPPDLSFFHIFGALCYQKNNSENLVQDSCQTLLLQHRLYHLQLFNPPPSVDFPTPEVIALINEVVAPEPAVSTSTPSPTIVDQDVLSPSNSQTTPETPPPVIPNAVEEDNHDIEVAHIGNDPYFGVPIPEIPSDQSSSSGSIHTVVNPDHQISKHNSKWTKDHPLENIISELA
ncbi:hypothetical protein Tco_0074950, partial [Tanacetum coccineum]